MSLFHDMSKEVLFEKHVQLSNTLHSAGNGTTGELNDLLNQLIQFVDLLEKSKSSKGKSKRKLEVDEVSKSKHENSLNLYKLVSRNLIGILQKLPNKVYDTANTLLSHLSVEETGNMSEACECVTIMLIDIIEAFPGSLSSLLGYTISQIYKILKKYPNLSANLVYLLSASLNNASRSDIDEKTQAKLMKLTTKCIMQYDVSLDLPINNTVLEETSITTVSIKKFYIAVLKRLLISSVKGSYEDLLASSVSSTSHTKNKSESLMTRQFQFQANLLASNEKIFHYGLSSGCKEIRLAMVELLAYLFISLIPNENFNIIEYLLSGLSLPKRVYWKDVLESQNYSEASAERKKDLNLVGLRDSEGIVNEVRDNRSLNAGIVETIVFYIQLEQLQNSDYLSLNLLNIIERLLLTFSNLSEDTVSNQHWKLIHNNILNISSYIINSCGLPCHQILTAYIYSKFTTLENNSSSLKESKLNQMEFRPNEFAFFSFLPDRSIKMKQKQNADLINPFRNYYQCSLLLNIVEYLIPYGIDFSSLEQVEKAPGKEELSTNSDSSTDQQDPSMDFKSDAANPNRSNSFLKSLLMNLLISKSSGIRSKSAVVLLKYAKNNEVEVNELISSLFNMVHKEYNSSQKTVRDLYTTNNNELRLISYSYALLLLIKETNPTLLQNSTILRILSFCTQNLKHNNHTHLGKNCASWLILSSLITFYTEFDFVKLNSSQLIVFWKNLLTSQFINESITSGKERQREIITNIKLRNFGLICLYNYLSVVELTPEIVRTLQFLLTKSYNYLNFLENIIPDIAVITSFSAQEFNEYDFPLNLVNNIPFTDEALAENLAAGPSLVSLVLYNKRILIQSFRKLISLKGCEINSNMVIFLVKLFADSKLFSRNPMTEAAKSKSKSKFRSKKKIKMNDWDDNQISLVDDYNYSFGISSLTSEVTADLAESLHCFRIVDRFKECNSSENSYNGYWNVSNNSKEVEFFSLDSQRNWYSYFEKSITDSVDRSLCYDPVALIMNDDLFSSYSTNLVTSLIDVAIDTFLLVFSHLTPKIQFSLLEQLRTFTESTSADPLRRRAIRANTSIALHKMLSYAYATEYELEKSVIESCLSILDKLAIEESTLIPITCDSVGLCCGILKQDRKFILNLSSGLVSRIVKDTNPYHRSRPMLSLLAIYKYSEAGFKESYSVCFQLLKDPHPIVFYYALSSMNILLEVAPVDKIHLIPGILEVLFEIYLDDSFSSQKGGKLMVNLKSKYNSLGQFSKAVKTCVTILGPTLVDSSSITKTQLRTLIFSLKYGIGCNSPNDYVEVYGNLLSLLQELIVYDQKLIENEVEFFKEFLNLLISRNLVIALSAASPTSVNKEAVFPFDSSYHIYESAYDCYLEITKIYGFKLINKDDTRLFWISMELLPCSSLKDMILLWLETEKEIDWFTILYSLYKISVKKLVTPYINEQFSQKLLPLSQRQKKNRVKSIDFRDEEIENIFGNESEDSEKVEPISWELKKFIYDLLNLLLSIGYDDTYILRQLESQIPELIKVAFLGSLSPITELKLEGINLLKKILELFGLKEDPMYPGVSILEQQQAEIISSLVPCFNAKCDPRVIVGAINVSSIFINLPRINYYSKTRILNTLIHLLEEISSGKFLRFKYLENISEYSKKEIQLSILNCWALLKLGFHNDGTCDTELTEALDKYSDLLNSLWILVLKDYATIKHSSTSVFEEELYHSYWLNFINVLALQINDELFIKKYLDEEYDNFLFVLFSQCFEALMKNDRTSDVLVSLNKLVTCPKLAEMLFNKEIFGELIDVFERIILINESSEARAYVIDIISTLICSYLSVRKDYQKDSGMLLELIRVLMLPMFSVFPFLKQSFNPQDENDKRLLKNIDATSSILILRKSYSKLIPIIQNFDEMTRTDLFCCLLFMIAKVYEFKNEVLISAILPLLKEIFVSLKTFNNGKALSSNAAHVIMSTYDIHEESEYVILTTAMLVTYSDIWLNANDSSILAKTLISYLKDESKAPISVQFIKSLIMQYPKPSAASCLRAVMNEVVSIMVKKEDDWDYKLLLEILMLYSKSENIEEEKRNSIYSILILIITELTQSPSVLPKSYLHHRMMFLVNLSPSSFKFAVNHTLNPLQKRIAEELFRFLSNSGSGSQLTSDEAEIHLKNFVS